MDFCHLDELGLGLAVSRAFTLKGVLGLTLVLLLISGKQRVRYSGE